MLHRAHSVNRTIDLGIRMRAVVSFHDFQCIVSMFNHVDLKIKSNSWFKDLYINMKKIKEISSEIIVEQDQNSFN